VARLTVRRHREGNARTFLGQGPPHPSLSQWKTLGNKEREEREGMKWASRWGLNHCGKAKRTK